MFARRHFDVRLELARAFTIENVSEGSVVLVKSLSRSGN
jgi:hypothetical protein